MAYSLMLNIKNLVMGIAIIILTVSVVVFGVGIVYDRPEYSDFCDEGPIVPRLPEACPTVCIPLYEIRGECVLNECGSGCGADGIKSFETLEQCESVLSKSMNGQRCSDNYNNALEKYSRNIFLIALPLGILIILVGAFLFGLESVGAGLMGGGVGVILWGVGGFWRFAQDWLKFVLSLIGLIVLIWFAYKYNKTGTISLRKRKRG